MNWIQSYILSKRERMGTNYPWWFCFFNFTFWYFLPCMQPSHSRKMSAIGGFFIHIHSYISQGHFITYLTFSLCQISLKVCHVFLLNRLFLHVFSVTLRVCQNCFWVGTSGSRCSPQDRPKVMPLAQILYALLYVLFKKLTILFADQPILPA